MTVVQSQHVRNVLHFTMFIKRVEYCDHRARRIVYFLVTNLVAIPKIQKNFVVSSLQNKAELPQKNVDPQNKLWTHEKHNKV